MCQAVCEPSHKQIRLLASPLRQQDPTGCSSVNQRRSVHLAPKMNASHLGEPLGTQVFGAISAAQMWPFGVHSRNVLRVARRTGIVLFHPPHRHATFLRRRPRPSAPRWCACSRC